MDQSVIATWRHVIERSEDRLLTTTSNGKMDQSTIIATSGGLGAVRSSASWPRSGLIVRGCHEVSEDAIGCHAASGRRGALLGAALLDETLWPRSSRYSSLLLLRMSVTRLRCCA